LFVFSAFQAPLIEIAKSENPDSIIAKQFLRILGKEVEGRIEGYQITNDEKETIKKTWRQYNGNVTSTMTRLMQNYGFYQDETTKKHRIFRHPKLGKVISISCTPSSQNAGISISQDVIKAIRELGEKGYYKN
jgi:predicted RNA binding protein YcfA (HicA-like mRNA interferase family)